MKEEDGFDSTEVMDSWGRDSRGAVNSQYNPSIDSMLNRASQWSIHNNFISHRCIRASQLSLHIPARPYPIRRRYRRFTGPRYGCPHRQRVEEGVWSCIPLVIVCDLTIRHSALFDENERTARWDRKKPYVDQPVSGPLQQGEERWALVPASVGRLVPQTISQKTLT
jgi:hypothetical protein